MDPVMLILLVGGGIALLLFIVGLVVTVTSEKSLVEERLGRYIEDEAALASHKGERASPVGDWLNVRLERSNWGESIAKELARADLKLKTGEYLAVLVIA